MLAISVKNVRLYNRRPFTQTNKLPHPDTFSRRGHVSISLPHFDKLACSFNSGIFEPHIITIFDNIS